MRPGNDESSTVLCKHDQKYSRFFQFEYPCLICLLFMPYRPNASKLSAAFTFSIFSSLFLVFYVKRLLAVLGKSARPTRLHLEKPILYLQDFLFGCSEVFDVFMKNIEPNKSSAKIPDAFLNHSSILIFPFSFILS